MTVTRSGLTQNYEKTNRKGRKGHVSAKPTLRVGAACPQDLRAACALAHRDKSLREFLRKSCKYNTKREKRMRQIYIPKPSLSLSFLMPYLMNA
ncbi:hypothetical protein SAMD00079811_49950 [Scytonema sp. HK-05]|nr:hypothetical protein SAMD00079811_49950 [Scytonema sp. HK-05]